MTLLSFSIAFILLPILSVGQITYDTSNCKISNDEIYSIIKLIIGREKLNKDYGIDVKPYKNTDIDYTDAKYLRTLLIKPPARDTTKKDTSDIMSLILPVSYPDKNILTQADIDYILCSQQTFQQFKWGNKRLNFDSTNKKNYYSFSIPFINLTHDKVVVKYEFLCPGLCGSGKSILLSRTNDGWKTINLEIWFH